jgi:5-amino-6-(5-phospho-D-ribitylamino)uracil phosphatase
VSLPGLGRPRTLLVSDLDGTLLGPDATLSETTIRVVNEYIADGGLFTYATGRSFTTAAMVTAPLNLRLPVVTYGGAVIVDPDTGRARQAQVLPADVVDEVFRVTGDSTLVQPIVFAIHEGRDRVCWRGDQITPGVDHFLRTHVGDPRLLPLRTWSSIDASSVVAICLISGEQPLRELRARLTGTDIRCQLLLTEDIYNRGDWWLELTSSTGTKGVALGVLKTELSADALVCFGDNHNDLSMFAVADTALAVANAASEIRMAATDVIGANTADGVARWIAEHRGAEPDQLVVRSAYVDS